MDNVLTRDVLSYDDFKKKLVDRITGEFLDCEVVVDGDEVYVKGTDTFVPCLSLSKYYSMFISSEYSFDKYCDCVVTAIHRIHEKTKKEFESYTTDDIFDYEKTKDRLTVRAIPLPKVTGRDIHFDIGDIALAIYVIVMNGDHSLVTFRPLSSVLDNWKMTKEEVLEVAFNNLQKNSPARIVSLVDMLNSLTEHEEIYDGYDVFEISECDPDVSYCVTTRDKINGAVTVFHKDVRKQISKILGGDFYISFTSQHEAMVQPADGALNPEELKEILIDVVENATSSDDFLSYSVYRYFKDTDEIKLVI